jgi:hypothetical protein
MLNYDPFTPPLLQRTIINKPMTQRVIFFKFIELFAREELMVFCQIKISS